MATPSEANTIPLNSTSTASFIPSHSQQEARSLYFSCWPQAISMPVLVGLVLGYLAICSSLRFWRINRLQRKMGFNDRASLARMSSDEAQLILRHIMEYEFPMFYELALQFAIFKTYGFESMSKLINSTKNLADPINAPKRYEDTVIIFGEFCLNPPSSDRALKAIARMNYLHSGYKTAGRISNEDFLYTLSVCVTEPTRFAALYEWRPFTDMERCAVGTHWKAVGDAMDIEYSGLLPRAGKWKDGIEFVEDITAWAKSYEVEAMKPSRSNIQPSRRLVELMIWHVPSFAKPFAEQVFAVLMGDRVREAFLYPEPSIVAGMAAFSALLLRRVVLRYLCLPRVFPKKYFSSPDPKTGRIQHYIYLVKPYYNPVTLWGRFGPSSWLTRALGGFVPGSEADLMTEGFLPSDLGPKDQVGKGTDEMAHNVEHMRGQNRGACPFSITRTAA